MSIIDKIAERYIQEAVDKGELSSLAGEGKPLHLDDDSHVPEELRAGYRLLKNAGYLPPELIQRNEAISLSEILKGLSKNSTDYNNTCKQLTILELRLQQAGMDTSFLHKEYNDKLNKQFDKKDTQ